MPVTRRRVRGTSLTVALALSAGVTGSALTLPAAVAAPTTPTITELHYDNAGADAGEAVEVSAPVGTDLTGWQVVLYNGSGGAAYDTFALPTPVGAGGGVTVDRAGIQNGSPDGLALVRPDGSVAEFLSYEGTFSATTGPAAGLTSTDIGVSEATDTAPGLSLQRGDDGVWVGPLPSTFVREDEPTEPTDVTIAEVQGSGDTTPLAGDLVRVEGVVTADLSTGGFDGLFVQADAAGGASPGGPSDGLFVYLTSDPANRPAATIGDRVRVTGTAGEFNGLTQLTIRTAADVELLATAQPLPEATPLILPLDPAGREALEGMLVAPQGPFTVTDVFDLGGFGEVGLVAGTAPARTPTDVVEPGAPAQALRAENLLRTLVLDDGVSRNLFTADVRPPYLSATTPVRVGDQVEAFSPVVLSQGFGVYRLQPTRPVTADTAPVDRTRFTPANSRPPAPAVQGDVQLASFNVLNYFTTLRVDLGCTPTGDCDARGAYDQAEFAVQQSKIVAAINALGAEVVTLEEIEDSAKLGEPVDEAVASLVAALNADAGAGTWAYVPASAELPDPAVRDFIRNAIIFKPAAVTPQGAARALGDQSDPGEAFAEAREPIAQTFVPAAGGEAFTVVGNHFKSKGSAASLPGDEDTGDGQGASNATRTVQAVALRDWVAGLQQETGVDDVFLQGDFNAYSREDPIDVLTAAGFVDLNSDSPFATGKSTYSFDGESGSLDHILASPSAFARVQDLDVWNINAVESRAYEYTALAQGLVDPASPYRSSDHDPEIVGIDDLAPVPPSCDRTISGPYVGRLIVTSGTTCLAAESLVVGTVEVAPGASLRADGATVLGAVRTDRADVVVLDGVTVVGPVSLAGTTGAVEVRGSSVLGALSLTDSSTAAPAVVSGTTVRGVLVCRGNVPPPTDEDVPNTVRGATLGQCRSL